MNIGKNVKKYRELKGLTQKQLANKLNYRTHTAIARIESGDNDIPVQKLESFAKVLDCNVIDLMYDDNPEVKKQLTNAIASMSSISTPTSNSTTDYNKLVNILGSEILLNLGKIVENTGYTTQDFMKFIDRAQDTDVKIIGALLSKILELQNPEK